MIDANPFWQDKTTGEPCPTRGHTLCTVTDPEHRHVAIPTPTAHVYARCTSVYVPMGAAATLMSYSRPGTAAALAKDPEEARRVILDAAKTA